jgi:hypothetical protein
MNEEHINSNKLMIRFDMVYWTPNLIYYQTTLMFMYYSLIYYPTTLIKKI